MTPIYDLICGLNIINLLKTRLKNYRVGIIGFLLFTKYSIIQSGYYHCEVSKTVIVVFYIPYWDCAPIFRERSREKKERLAGSWERPRWKFLVLSGLSDSPTEKFYSLIPHFLNLPISVKRCSIRTKVLHRADFFFRFDPKYKNFEFEAKVFHDFAYNKAILYDNLNVGFHLLATMTYPDTTFIENGLINVQKKAVCQVLNLLPITASANNGRAIQENTRKVWFLSF